MSECVCPCVSSPARTRSKEILARRAKHKSNSCFFFFAVLLSVYVSADSHRGEVCQRR